MTVIYLKQVKRGNKFFKLINKFVKPLDTKCKLRYNTNIEGRGK